MDLELENIVEQASSQNLNEVKQPRKIVEDLFAPKANIFWSDLLLSASFGWTAFVCACVTKPLSWQMFAAIPIAAITLYRALIFIHELAHLRANALPGFAQVWNLIVGIPLLFPSCIYVGVHADHHRLATYGTAQDPEYQPFAGSKLAIVLFVAHSLMIPALLVLRFLVLSPFALLFPPLHRFLERHASSLSMNLAYCRKVSDGQRVSMIRTEVLMLIMWMIPISLAWQDVLPWRIFAIWYGIMASITFINSLRTLAAHRYRSLGSSMNQDNQILDSIDTPGTFWTAIWAPVGLRYHALHHYFPTMPYHNLSIAHQRLIQTLPADSPYCLAISPSIWHSLQKLWNECH